MYKSSKSDMGRRAWNILRLALLWTRKGGVFALKKRIMLSHFNHSNKHLGFLQEGDRQLSFDATPIIHVKMHRPNSMRFHLPHIPCINPQTSDSDLFDFDYQSESDPSMVEVLVPNNSDKTVTVCEVTTIGVPAKSGNGSLWEQFSRTHVVSTSKESSSLSLSDASDEDVVCMPDVLPGAGFLDDLQSYDSYEYQALAVG
ncbi:hypothetical protein CTI12_AA243610 [Artemisia annua]|uniref:Uncharacterized protein n=1 Tax=Artemisia annua TaxID=35608 RepID=A0A2U1MXJ1_ARTAN|nr:hypothetical protein CTI12_AA243610 [Artemisia annua]